MTIEQKPPLWRRAAYFVVGDLGIGTIARLLVAFVVFCGTIIAHYQGWSIHLAWTTAVVASYVAILITSPALRSRFQQEDFVGYWEYENKPDENKQNSQFEQQQERKRIVKIDRDQGEMRIRGWLAGDPRTCLFDASKVVLTRFGRKSGNLFYWYKSPEHAPQSRRFFGLVVIEWHKEFAAGEVVSMSGRYYGHTSKSMGTVVYKRISDADFLAFQDELTQQQQDSHSITYAEGD